MSEFDLACTLSTSQCLILDQILLFVIWGISHPSVRMAKSVFIYVLWYHLILLHSFGSFFCFILSIILSPPLVFPSCQNYTFHLSHLVIFLCSPTSVCCSTHVFLAWVSSRREGKSSWSAVFCLFVKTEMLRLMRKEELSASSSLFEHVQCAIMLAHLFSLRGW